MTDENTPNDAGEEKVTRDFPEDDTVRELREAERRRGRSRPFDYPYEERRAGVRARRHISREEAGADMPPGLSGGYGTTGGGQPSGPGHVRPGRTVTGEDPAGVADEEDTTGEEETGR
ncbi:MAG TPA: hypothetical protein VFY14_00925 [Streptomyces sp.]|nr:hypothetical protein [Streptomyces sp.]